MKKFTILPKASGYTRQFDLLEDEVYQEQRANALKYQKRSLAGKIGFILFGALGYLGMFYFHKVPSIVGILFGLSMVIAFIGSLFARCPHCGSLQPGRVYGLSFSGKSLLTSYSKGIWPFASRCAKCEYYLSPRQLEKDRTLLLKNQTKGLSAG